MERDVDPEDLERIIEDAKKGIFKYNGINLESAFKERDFLIGFYHLAQLKDWEKKIKETKGNPLPGDRRDLAELLFGDPRVGLKLDELIIRDASKEGRKSAQKRMVEYARRNYASLMKAIEDDEDGDELLTNLAFSVPLYFIGDKKHDTVVKFIRAVKEAESAIKAAQQGDPSKMRKIAEGKVKDKNVPDWGRKLLQYYLHDETFVQLVFQGEAQARSVIARATLTSDGKNIDKRKIKDIVQDSLIEAHRHYNSETDEGKKGNIYTDGIAPIYEAVAGTAYGPIMKKYQKDLERDHPEMKDLRERAEEGEKVGIGVGMDEIPEYAERYH